MDSTKQSVEPEGGYATYQDHDQFLRHLADRVIYRYYKEGTPPRDSIAQYGVKYSLHPYDVDTVDEYAWEKTNGWGMETC
jgi:hypothetical protein